MGEVEACAGGKVSPSVGERLQAVLAQLPKRRPPIAEVALLDPIDAFPARWRQVLRLFPVRACDRLSEPVAQGLLGEIQRAVLAMHAGRPVTPIDFRDDGSLLVQRAETRLLAARWMAERLRDERDDVLIVAGADGVLLDETLSAADLPRQGFRDANAFRPSLQLLPLAMGLLWEPLDLYGALQFLTHPICPLPRRARWHLAEALANQPGIGGDAWATALQKAVSKEGEGAAGLGEAIRVWLEHERFRPQPGAPVFAVLARARALAEFFRVRLGEEDPALRIAYLAGHAQVDAFIGGLERLERQGLTVLPRAQLEQLVAQVTARGSGNALLRAEVGCRLTATDPAAVTEPCGTVIWWQPARAGGGRRWPWSDRELAELARCGVALPSAQSMLAEAAASWTRPLRAARHRLELVLPPEGEEVHPVWLMLGSLVRGLPVHRLERVLTRGEGPETAVLERRPLPPRVRWWRIAAGSIPRRDSESFTSFDLLLNSPFEWVLKHAAGLRAVGRARGERRAAAVRKAGAPAGRGRVRSSRRADDDGCRVRAVARRRAGACRLRGGRGAAHARATRRPRALPCAHSPSVRRAAGTAGASGCSPGRTRDGVGGVVRRRPDPRLGGPGGVQAGRVARAILDLKWGRTKHYSELLADNRHLQLAVYAELLRQQTNRCLAGGRLFLLDAGRLVARSKAFFPGAHVVRSSSDETTAHVWQRFLATWRWRMDQIDAGSIEVVVDDIEATPESVEPEDGLAIAARNLAWSHFANLVGWRAGP